MTAPPPHPGRRPYVRCRRIPELDGQEVPIAFPGAILEGTDGEVVIFVGDTWPTEQVDIPALAPRLRGVRLVTLIGHIQQAGKPCKRELQRVWDAENRAHRNAVRATKPPTPPRTRAALCGQPTRDGDPCKQIAGAGTDTTGTGPCLFHGGDSTQRDAAAAKLTQAIRVNALLTAKSRTRDLTLREQLDQLIALREIALAAETKRRRTRTR